MIAPAKLSIFAIPVVVAAFVWPFTSTETVLLMTTAGGMVVSIIGAIKANAAKVAVNGHLAKLEKEQDKSKSEREAEFARFLQVTKDAARAEGEETARKAAEFLAAKVAEGVALAAKVSLAHQPTPAAPPSGASRIGEAITELKAAADATSVAADKTVSIVDKQNPKV